MKSTLRFPRDVLVVTLLGAFCVTLPQSSRPAMAQALPASPRPQAAPCCSITAINTRAGQVMARVKASGQIFTFTASIGVLNSLKLGQGVYANFTSKQVSLDGRTVCCQIVSIATAASTPALQPVPATVPVGTATSGVARNGRDHDLVETEQGRT